MASTKISALPAVTTPAAADGFAVNQGGVTKLETRAQIHSLEVGEHFLLPLEDDAATPSLAFGDGNTGFYESTDNILRVSLAGINQFFFNGNQFNGVDANSAQLLNEAASATNPTLIPSKADINTGIGWVSADRGSLVAGALDCMQWEEIASARALGFYVTAPIVLQTGVTVDSAGIHAALVNLGLITA